MKSPSWNWTLLGLSTLMVACVVPMGPGPNTNIALQNRASFDLGCPKDQLTIVDIDDRTRGVSGCGKKSVYLYVCQTAGAPSSCTWVLNGESPK